MRLETVACDYCQSETSEPVYDVNGSEKPERFRIVRCNECGLHFVNPRPDVSSIAEYYGSTYYAHQAPGDGPTTKERVRSVALEIMGGYRWRPFGALVPRGLLDVVVPASFGKTLLDVGCGSGERAAWYGKRGFKVYGVEISEQAASFASAKGVEVALGQLMDANFPDDFFDVVIVAHVLEHTHQPGSYLREISRILKYDGLAAIAVPNIESHSARTLGALWALLEPPVHLYHFSRSTLGKYLGKSGLRIESCASKTVYSQMIRKSLVSVRHSRSRLARLSFWVRTGWLPSLLQMCVRGHDASDAFTFYCRKRRAS